MEAGIIIAGVVILAVVGIVMSNKGKKDENAPVYDPNPVVPPSPSTRKKLHYGFFGCVEGQLDATKGFVNTHMIGWWIPDKVAEALKAFDSGLSIIINPAPEESDLIGLDNLFSKLESHGILHAVVGLYWDEPDQGFSPNLSQVRAAMANYPQLSDCRLATCIADLNHNYDFSGYGLVMVTAYDQGEGALQSKVKQLRARLRADQSLGLVVWGADPWRTSPDAFYQYAMADSKVEWLLAFTWFDGDPSQAGHGLGIAKNGLLSQYVATGLKIR